MRCESTRPARICLNLFERTIMNAKLATTTLIVLSSLVAGTSFAGDNNARPQVGDVDVA